MTNFASYKIDVDADEEKLLELLSNENPKSLTATEKNFILDQMLIPARLALITADHVLSFNLAKWVLDDRFTEGESTISKNSEYAFRYAAEVVKGEWPLGENAMLANPQYAYRYAAEVLKARWPVGEHAIAQNAFTSYQYAKNVVNGRFQMGESAINANSSMKEQYGKFVDKLPPNALHYHNGS